jgi:hypothetical protein
MGFAVARGRVHDGPMRYAALLSVVALGSLVSTAHAQVPQAPRPLPARIRAAVGMPGTSTTSYANVTLDLGPLPWTMVGCVSRVEATCFATQRVVLSDADRVALVTRVQEVYAVPRCEPEGFSPGDPRYSMDFPANHYAGHLPADPSAIAARTAGPCGAPARLAWWLAERFSAGSRGPR